MVSTVRLAEAGVPECVGSPGVTVTAKDLNDQYPSYRVIILTPAGQRLNVTDDSSPVTSS